MGTPIIQSMKQEGSHHQRQVGIVIQSRMGSSRLPGKALMEVEGMPLIAWTIVRMKQCQHIPLIICALPTSAENKVLAQVCREYGAEVFLGSEEDVLDRYVQCCDAYQLTDVVRVTGDCPLLDPAIVDRLVEQHLAAEWDMTANVVDEPGGFPRGMDVEVTRVDTLRTVNEKPIAPRYREHVTLYLYEHTDRFSTHIAPPTQEECRPEIRLCVDYEADLDAVRDICRHFKGRRDFSLSEILAFLDQKDGSPGTAKNLSERSASP